ncbi:MAG TPA: Flp family type IVb pilin [Devosia sp.]|nr:Flp family type IVb pilin [Devosia sp.]
MRTAIARFVHDDTGATAIEYGLIAGLIAVALVGTLAVFGDSLRLLYAGGSGSAATAMTDALARAQ